MASGAALEAHGAGSSRDRGTLSTRRRANHARCQARFAACEAPLSSTSLLFSRRDALCSHGSTVFRRRRAASSRRGASHCATMSPGSGTRRPARRLRRLARWRPRDTMRSVHARKTRAPDPGRCPVCDRRCGDGCAVDDARRVDVAPAERDVGRAGARAQRSGVAGARGRTASRRSTLRCRGCPWPSGRTWRATGSRRRTSRRPRAAPSTSSTPTIRGRCRSRAPARCRCSRSPPRWCGCGRAAPRGPWWR